MKTKKVADMLKNFGSSPMLPLIQTLQRIELAKEINIKLFLTQNRHEKRRF